VSKEDFLESGVTTGRRAFNKKGTWCFLEVDIPKDVKQELKQHEFTANDLKRLVDAVLGSGCTLKIGQTRDMRSYTVTVIRPKRDTDSFGTSMSSFGSELGHALAATLWRFTYALQGDFDLALDDVDDDIG